MGAGPAPHSALPPLGEGGPPRWGGRARPRRGRAGRGASSLQGLGERQQGPAAKGPAQAEGRENPSGLGLFFSSRGKTCLPFSCAGAGFLLQWEQGNPEEEKGRHHHGSDRSPELERGPASLRGEDRAVLRGGAGQKRLQGLFRAVRQLRPKGRAGQYAPAADDRRAGHTGEAGLCGQGPSGSTLCPGCTSPPGRPYSSTIWTRRPCAP